MISAFITVTTRLVSTNINWTQTTEDTKIGVYFNKTKIGDKIVNAKHKKTPAHQHQKHGENAKCPLHGENAKPSSGVDNEADYTHSPPKANYAHSPPKGCGTATAKPVGCRGAYH